MKHCTVIFGTFLAALVLATPGASALDLAPLAHATVEGDAEAEYVAVSAFGDARCEHDQCVAVSAFGNARCEDIACAAVSGTGDAGQRTSGGECYGGVSVSVEGDACSFHAALSGFGTASASNAPLSVFGKCEGFHPSYYAPRECFDLLGSNNGQGYWLSVSDSGSSESRWVAISKDGDSYGHVALSGDGDAEGNVVAASGTGAANCGEELAGCYLIASGASDANCQSLSIISNILFCLAFAPLGDADASGENSIPFSLVGYCNGVRCFAVDPLGPADGYWVGASGTGDASGIVAFSIFGDADGTVAISLKDVLCDPDGVCIGP